MIRKIGKMMPPFCSTLRRGGILFANSVKRKPVHLFPVFKIQSLMSIITLVRFLRSFIASPVSRE